MQSVDKCPVHVDYTLLISPPENLNLLHFKVITSLKPSGLSVTPRGHLKNRSQDWVFASYPRSGVHASPLRSLSSRGESGGEGAVGGAGVLQVGQGWDWGDFCLAPPSPSCPLVDPQSPRMTLTKLATSVSLVSWEEKKGCCCRGDGTVRTVLQKGTNLYVHAL